jgi:hypothetical protein
MLLYLEHAQLIFFCPDNTWSIILRSSEKYTRYEHDMAIALVQATTRHPQDRTVLELEGSRLNDGHVLYSLSRSQATWSWISNTPLIKDTQWSDQATLEMIRKSTTSKTYPKFRNLR